MTVQALAAFFPGGRWRGDTYETHCPCPGHAHSDRNPSLGISPGENGGVVICCQKGHAAAEIMAAVGLSMRELAPPSVNGASPSRFSPEAVYRYDDEQGRPLYEKVRLPGGAAQRFFLRLPGQASGGIGDTRRVLYRLPELLATKPGDTIAIVEGEKDADNVARQGVAATTNPEGAALPGQQPKWRAAYTRWLALHLPDRRFAVFADNDEAGLAHAEHIVAALKGAGLKVFAVNLEGLAEKEDVSDWLGRHSAAEFQALLTPVVRFPLLSIEDMLELPEPAWEMEGIWERAGIVMVYGEGGSGKTFLVVDMLMHLICGLDWYGRRVEPGPVLYVNADGGIPFRNRLQAWLFENPEAKRLHPFLIYNNRLDMRQPGLFKDFVAEQKERPDPPRIIVLDTFHRCMPGADENDARDTSQFFDALGLARQELEASSFFVHHSNRSDTGHRGHSSLRDDADTAIEVRRESSGLRRVRCDKQRNAVEFPEFFFDLRPTLGGLSCVVEMNAPPEEDDEDARPRRGPTKGEEGQIQLALRLIIEAGELTQAELMGQLGKSQPRVSFYCRTLRQRGLIEIRQGLIDTQGRRPVLYSPRPELRRRDA